MRTALQVYAVYVFVVGVLLLFPAWASAVFAREVMDAAVTSGWGADLIVLALFAYVASTDVAKYRGLAWVFVVGLVLPAVDLAYFWATGAYTTRTALAPIVINLALAAWLWTTRSKAVA